MDENITNIENINADTEIIIELDQNISRNQLGDFQIGLTMWIESNCQSSVSSVINYSDLVYKVPKKLTITFSDRKEAILFKLSNLWQNDIIKKS